MQRSPCTQGIALATAWLLTLPFNLQRQTHCFQVGAVFSATEGFSRCVIFCFRSEKKACFESKGRASHWLTKVNHRGWGTVGADRRQEVVRRGWERISAILEEGMEEVEGDWWLLHSFSGHSHSYPDIWLAMFLLIKKKKLAEHVILEFCFINT